jgi:hypothetical protein
MSASGVPDEIRPFLTGFCAMREGEHLRAWFSRLWSSDEGQTRLRALALYGPPSVARWMIEQTVGRPGMTIRRESINLDVTLDLARLSPDVRAALAALTEARAAAVRHADTDAARVPQDEE